MTTPQNNIAPQIATAILSELRQSDLRSRQQTRTREAKKQLREMQRLTHRQSSGVFIENDHNFNGGDVFIED